MPDRAWYYSSGGQQRGPIKTAQLKRLAVSGELRPSDLVWTDSMANWSPASTVKGLFPADAVPLVATGESPASPADGVEPQAALQPQVVIASPNEAAPYSQQLSAATQLAGAASREAVGAFKTLITDPIGGLEPCYAKLGNARAMQVGVVFLVAAIAVFALASLISSGNFRPALNDAVAAVLAVAAMIGVSFAFRSMISRAASYHADLFIVGAASLPFAVATFLGSILNRTNEIVAIIAMTISVFGGTFSLLMFFKGQASINRLSERTGALAVACIASAGVLAYHLMMRLLS